MSRFKVWIQEFDFDGTPPKSLIKIVEAAGFYVAESGFFVFYDENDNYFLAMSGVTRVERMEDGDAPACGDPNCG